MSKVNPHLQEQLKGLIGSMGYELIGTELLPQGRQMVFRIYIDSETGVTLDDCSHVSHQISAMLDVEDPIQGRYALEVSSPGINRPLFELAHYYKCLGKKVKIRLRSPVCQRKQFKGILLRVEEDEICLLDDGLEQEVMLPFSEIEKANLIGEVTF
jgi:ribosome maturation factor RimP